MNKWDELCKKYWKSGIDMSPEIWHNLTWEQKVDQFENYYYWDKEKLRETLSDWKEWREDREKYIGLHKNDKNSK